ncbi:MAG TPA: hypothetical protein VHH88_00030, partial [Verrucomicrobiae bacterium]|nr:hypothetical protein [Verrucomicrobiae bacterium]
MMRLRHALPVLALMLLSASAFAQTDPGWTIQPLNGTNGWVEWNPETGIARGSNGVFFRYSGSVMTANEMEVDPKTGKVTADGNVRYQKDEQIWT